MKTSELRETLGEVINGLRDGSIDVKVATEITNASGKILNSIKIDLAGAMLLQSNPSFNHPCLTLSDVNPAIIAESEED